MSQTKKDTIEYIVLISISPVELAANKGFEDNPMEALKKLVKDTAPISEVVKDTISELEMKVWCMGKGERNR